VGGLFPAPDFASADAVLLRADAGSPQENYLGAASNGIDIPDNVLLFATSSIAPVPR
jgi:hypothetical protein